MKRGENAYTDESILDKAATFESLAGLRSANFSFYQLIRRRELLAEVRHRFNVKAVERYLASKIEKEKAEAMKVSQEAPKKRGRGPNKIKKEPKPAKVKKENPTRGLQIYKHTFQDGVKVCGRCFLESTKTPKSILCLKCQRVYARMYAYERPHVPWNIKQEFCNTTISHYEKRFELGIRAEERMQNYLTMVGYGFIFQDPWENIWK